MPPAPSTPTPAPALPTTALFLERNLRALGHRNAETARRIAEAVAAPNLSFAMTDDGVPTALMGAGSSAQSLCSRRRPLDEAKRLIDTVDIKAAAIFVVAGFGLGYHVRELAQRLGKTGLVVVFEPDVSLLRAVFENVDCAAWLGNPNLNIAIVTDPDDSGAMGTVLKGLEGVVALGVQLVEHPASKSRLAAMGNHVGRFHEQFVTLVKGIKLTIVTTLVQIRTTIRNLSQNIDHYLIHPGIDELQGLFAGRPAIVVSAGPSLARNIELLSRPGLRDRFVIIAVQTVLKNLLAKGIRPHFVTALDYSDISARFYEGLTPADVEGVTLVVEPKVNPAVLDAFPYDPSAAAGERSGGIRCTGDRYLDQLLTAAHAPPHAQLTPGATVAHLAYYFARFLGCEPVALIGQDLAFTDGQYYAANAAIHRTWAGELNEFHTLESMEWQRIARMGQHLHRATDVFDRPVFTDEQMNSYRLQFERDFMSDAAKGLQVFDCTEGGIKKLYTTPCALAEFLDTFSDPQAPSIRVPAALPHAPETAQARLKAALRHLKDVRGKARRVGDLSRQATDILTQMREHLNDNERVNRLIDKTQLLRRQVEDLEPAYGMVHLLNQSGALNRMRADRLLQLDTHLELAEVQRREIDRDAENVRSLARSADELGTLLDHAIDALPESVGGASAPKLTRDPAPSHAQQPIDGSAGDTPIVPSTGLSRVCAVIPFDHRVTPLGIPRTGRLAPSRPVLGTMPALRLTIERLSRVKHLCAIVIAATDIAVARSIVPATVNDKRIEFIPLLEADLPPSSSRTLAAARIFAADSWRSAPGGFTCYDEVFHPRAAVAALDLVHADAAFIVGPDWCFVDPALCDQVIERHQSNPTANRLTFTQAPPGFCGAVTHRSLLEDVLLLRDASQSAAATGANKFASIGGMLAYVPSSPATDLIAYPVCVTIPPSLRDCNLRLTLDRAPGHAEQLLTTLQSAALGAGFEALLHAVDQSSGLCASSASAPQLTVQIAAMSGPGPDATVIYADVETIIRRIRAAAANRPDLAITLIGSRLDSVDLRADPLNHPRIFDLFRALRAEEPPSQSPRQSASPVSSIHLRTGLLVEPEQIDSLLELDPTVVPDILSVDLLAESAATYRAVSGHDHYGQARANLEHLLNSRQRASALRAHPSEWLRAPLVVVRMTRCDAAYAEVETFYNRWMSLADWSVIDPLPCPREGERIQPLPLPKSASDRFARTQRTITLAELRT